MPILMILKEVQPQLILRMLELGIWQVYLKANHDYFLRQVYRTILHMDITEQGLTGTQGLQGTTGIQGAINSQPADTLMQSYLYR